MVLKRVLSVLLILSFAAATGCGSMQRASEHKETISSSEASSEVVIEELQKPYKSPLGEVELTDNKMSRMWLKYFQGRGRKHMERYLERSSRYLPMMKKVLREEGLPEELVYVALIESGFRPTAHSHANAVGYWQFIRGTGKNYGLKIDGLMDERRDPVLSTRAAAAYFKALYNLFGKWHLALAAYNTGENRVKNRVMRYQTRDFWELARRRTLPRETRNYVPKFIAAAKIALDPEKYGFTGIEYQEPLAYDTVEVGEPISLHQLASKLNVARADLIRLNPKFRGEYVPQYKDRDMRIRVPVGMGLLAKGYLPAVKMAQPKYVYRDHFYYRVRRGDTLGHIARKYRTSVGTLKRINHMGRRTMIRVGQRIRVPERGGPRKIYSQASSSKSSDRRRSVDRSLDHHIVRRGENLTLIARKYGVSVSQLQQRNSLGRRSVLKPGQKLVIRQATAAKADGTGGGKAVYHVVRRGENLSLIARRYGVSIAELMRRNGLNRRAIIRVGQRLKIKEEAEAEASPSSKVFYHRVRRGENLSLIAEKYGSTVREIASLNNLKSRSFLRVGQKLKVQSNKVHVVRRGENLSLIANKYRVNVKDIVNANNLRSRSLIAAGQSLVIPD
jgi:membrane-bound lytic murein transglycosylase D